MKRNKAESSNPSKLPSPPSKTQKKTRVTNPKKPLKANGGTARTALMAPANDPSPSPSPVEVKEEVVELMGLEGGDNHCWWWGVEEDVLLGWFPFVAEHFAWAENRGSASSSLFWEEEEGGANYDIWQLQHIHEIPNK